MFRHHSSVGVAAYTDLLRLLKDEAVSELRGAPRLKQVGAKAYWYDHYRIGAATVDRYIGEDAPELRARLERHRALAEARRQVARERARLTRVLRAEGYLMTDAATGQVVSALARAGVFRLGGTLVGTHAFRCYDAAMGVRIGFDDAAMTDDIDIASFERLSLVLDDRVETPLSDVFAELKFDPVPSLDRGKVWRWRQSGRGALIEFLTPSFDEREDIRDLRALGVSAQSLHFLNYLIADPMQVAFLYRDGVLAQVPRPERFAIHKLIVADRRLDGPDSQKARKDRAQAAFLVRVLAEEAPHDLAEAYEAALSSGPAWRKRIAASLARMPETSSALGSLPA